MGYDTPNPHLVRKSSYSPQKRAIPWGYTPSIFRHIQKIFNYISGYLVGGAINILKNMKVNGKDYPIYDGKNV
jgi:hypothetical protein